MSLTRSYTIFKYRLVITESVFITTAIWLLLENVHDLISNRYTYA